MGQTLVRAPKLIAAKNENFKERLISLFPLLGSCLLLTIILLVSLIKILSLNNGFFVYTLDDAYIHLSLAENINKGHYGVNLAEFSSPSSSILWPFLLAPFAQFELTPLIINILASFGTLYIYYLLIWDSIKINKNNSKPLIAMILLGGMVTVANFPGLILMGMEHSLQLFVVAAIVWGLILFIKDNKIRPWLMIALLFAPMIRYEDLSISIAAIIFLIFNGSFRKSVGFLFLITFILSGFALFLIYNNQMILPASIYVKTSFHSENLLAVFAKNYLNNMDSWFGIFGSVWAFILFIYTIIFVKNRKKRLLVLVTILAINLHLLAGKVGWTRYEVYVYTFLMLVSIDIFSEPLSRFLNHPKVRWRFIAFTFTTIMLFIFLSYPYLLLWPSWPIGSNNIYSQHFQMHRFVTQYYMAPVAVNDLGYVSYKNDHYVLDLYGLASLDALQYRLSEEDGQWMDNLASEKNVKLAMIYEKWFDHIPESWIKIGDLVLLGDSITPAVSRVSFYITDPDFKFEIEHALDDFLPTLPDTARFIFAE